MRTLVTFVVAVLFLSLGVLSARFAHANDGNGGFVTDTCVGNEGCTDACANQTGPQGAHASVRRDGIYGEYCDFQGTGRTCDEDATSLPCGTFYYYDGWGCSGAPRFTVPDQSPAYISCQYEQ